MNDEKVQVRTSNKISGELGPIGMVSLEFSQSYECRDDNDSALHPLSGAERCAVVSSQYSGDIMPDL